MSEFYTAFAEYLERMLEETDDLTAVVALETVPDWALAQTQEWALVA